MMPKPPALLVALSMLFFSATVKAKTWPTVKPVHKELVFDELNKNLERDTPVVSLVKNLSGTPIYKIECHSGNYDGAAPMNFSGDFQCAMFAIRGSHITSGDLLATNEREELASDWWNRGRMRSAQLRDDCLGYPNYSTDRRFELRGMIVTMRFRKIKWSEDYDAQGAPLLAGFTFQLEVVPEPSVTDSRAALPPNPKPPTHCYP